MLPISIEPLIATLCGPHTTDKKVSDVEHLACRLDRRKVKKMYYVNLLKSYCESDDDTITQTCSCTKSKHFCRGCDIRLENANILSNVASKIPHLDRSQQEEIIAIHREYGNLFDHEPERADLKCHDVDVRQARPIRQQLYRVSPDKLKLVRKEIKNILDQKIIAPSQTHWNLPFTVASTTDGS